MRREILTRGKRETKSFMPIYEYTCLKCNAHTEVLQKITDKPLTRCRKCGGKLAKQWSQTSFQLKGTGWYVTDYAAKNSDAAEKKGEPAGAESVSTDAAAKGGGAEKQKKATDSSKAEGAKSGDAVEKKSTGKSKKSTTTSSSSGD